MKKRKIIIVYNLVALILIIGVAILNLNNNHYLSQEIIFYINASIYIILLIGTLCISLYHFFKKENDKYLGYTFLICFGINIFFLLCFIVWVFAQSAIGASGAITG